MNEVISNVAARRNMREEQIESAYTYEQILLKRHFDVREERRLMNYQADLTSSKTAEIIAKAFGG